MCLPACAGGDACSGGTSGPAVLPTPAQPHGHVQRAGQLQRRQRRRSPCPHMPNAQRSTQSAATATEDGEWRPLHLCLIRACRWHTHHC